MSGLRTSGGASPQQPPFCDFHLAGVCLFHIGAFSTGKPQARMLGFACLSAITPRVFRHRCSNRSLVVIQAKKSFVRPWKAGLGR